MTDATVEICVHGPPCEASLRRLCAVVGVRVADIPMEDEEAPWSVPGDVAADTRIILAPVAPVNLDRMSSLQMIQATSVGYSQFYGLGLAERGVRVCNAAGVFDAPIAEWNIAMMVNLARDLRGMIRNQQRRHWDRSARFQREIGDATVGFWGYGGIGRETARLCKQLGMTVHVLTRSPVGPRTNTYVVPGKGDPRGILPDRCFTPPQKEQFLRGLDFLVVAMPLTSQTEGLIGERELRALPPHACILNPARGPIIREAALLRALAEGWIAGAALDTHYDYPMPPDHPLWRAPNVIMTPHVSGSTGTQTYNRRVWEIFVTNVERLLGDRPLVNELSVPQLANAV